MNTNHFCELERARTQAIVARDITLLERLHATDYELVTPGGRVITRSRYLELIADAPFYTSWELGPMQVLARETMGAVKYQARLKFPSGRVIQCWHTDIYELRGSAWQAVWSQATELPATPPTGASTSAA
ncbi:nuclear transport factor 2 family protein [Roseateles sp. BYS180W]|uniref:Nuclear transport factor 2 family protein n=1 Tax=Roseateles rivi TaxID=3299028 RepID=A0ABW7FQY0_9BURK